MRFSRKWTLAVVAAFLVGFVVGQSLFGAVRYESPVWGTVGEWVGGLGSAAAALAAVWQMGHLIARERSSDERARIGAAMGVTVSGPTRWEGLGDSVWRFDVRNASAFPAYRVELVITLDSEEVARHAIGALGAGQFVGLDTEVPGRRDVESRLKAELTFRDGAGMWWVSGADGVKVTHRPDTR